MKGFSICSSSTRSAIWENPVGKEGQKRCSMVSGFLSQKPLKLVDNPSRYSQPGRRFRYLSLITTILTIFFFYSLLSLSFDWGDIPKKLLTMFHYIKNALFASYFRLFSWCLEMRQYTASSDVFILNACFIYYLSFMIVTKANRLSTYQN